ncbi:MAG: 16S rRNA (cytidine(1402)-2'-O)-methyltransferase [Acidimicrobiaceae bacterium]|nr:16S rRNA (cytidine(1402)-2'-O)-methyltransferase [Acidimicrobiaceae bacterium]
MTDQPRPASEAAIGTPAEGRIVLVGTPIGNLGDLSPRAAETLAGADVICCEDTRHTRKLLSAAGIPAPRLVALHEHNERGAGEYAVRLAEEGKEVAVVCDAGMPGISDPGERVVRAAARAGVRVDVVPGPSAVVTALVLSGLPTDRFSFEGFLPRKGTERRRRLTSIGSEERTTVVYESPHRVAKTLADLREVCRGSRRVALVRELTKRFEEVWRGTLDEAVARAEDDEPRGEWVMVLEGEEPEGPDDEAITDALSDLLAEGTERRTAVEEVSASLGVPRNRVYRLALARSEDPGP